MCGVEENGERERDLNFKFEKFLRRNNARGFLSLFLSLLNVWCVEEKRAGERFLDLNFKFEKFLRRNNARGFLFFFLSLSLC